MDTLKQHGAFTKEAQDEAYDRAKAYVLKLLNTDAVELLGELYGDLDVWLETMIESAVNSLKTAAQEYAVDIQVDGD